MDVYISGTALSSLAQKQYAVRALRGLVLDTYGPRVVTTKNEGDILLHSSIMLVRNSKMKSELNDVVKA